MDFDDLDTALEERLEEVKAGGDVNEGLAAMMKGSGLQRTVVLKVMKGDSAKATLEMPLDANTKVRDLKAQIAERTLKLPSDLEFSSKDGSSLKKLEDDTLVPAEVIVTGVENFKPQRKVWPHPIGIIGAGYNALKTAMTYIIDGQENFTMFDRNDKVGGYCWITGANDTSRLQTEFGSFHLWWGPDFPATGIVDYPVCRAAGAPESDGYHIWPSKKNILKMFHETAEKFGILPHIQFKTNVSKIDIVGDPEKESRYYRFIVDSLEDPKVSKQYQFSVVYHYPGSLTKFRIIDYPGQDTFGGTMAYGMGDDVNTEKLKGARVAMLGNGAFAVENARTAIECGATKTYIITRRKNMASPRLPCWFVHQGPLATPGRLVVKMFEPMYKMSGFGDPWSYHAVHADAKRHNVTILQNSRFGIHDCTFLMHVWGLLEYKEDLVKRFSKHTVHLTKGDKLEDITYVVKCLGLLGDWTVDKLQNITYTQGPLLEGDFRRILNHDATGMNAANFTTFSLGISITGFVTTWKYFHDFPHEWYKIQEQAIQTLPIHKAQPDIEKPAYVTDVKFAMAGGFIIGGLAPQTGWFSASHESYKYHMYHKAHNLDHTLAVATEEWDAYQKDWKARGIEHEHVPYPYTRPMIEKWFEEWSDAMHMTLSADGPGPEGVTLPASEFIVNPKKPLTSEECFDLNYNKFVGHVGAK